MKVGDRITCLSGACAALALGFAAGLVTASPPAGEDGAYKRASAAATDIRVAVDASLGACDEACRQSWGIEAVTLLGNRPPR
ncbi:hypothetical protein [Cupriavidus sp. SK-3]|uniref:hypothetical protein n=1 Tax=Cupriavidus sp. SK-3 TaxID=1470558 RepID=UPI000B08516F|nr:hypothetical protein [Cupriavidus sp. SK-3]